MTREEVLKKIGSLNVELRLAKRELYLVDAGAIHRRCGHCGGPIRIQAKLKTKFCSPKCKIARSRA